MAVKTHPSIPGAYLIDWWQPDGKVNPKTGKPKPRRHYETYPGSREDAERRHQELVRRHISLAKPLANPKINDALKEFRLWIDTNKSKNYYRSWTWALVKLQPAFGDKPVSQITEILIEEFKRKYKSTPVHTNQCLDYLKILINWMVARNMANPLPFKIVKLQYDKPLPQPPSPAAVDDIFAEIESRFQDGWKRARAYKLKLAIIHIMYDGGARWCEARHIRWENIDWDRQAVYLDITKTGKPRYTLIPDEAMTIFQKYKEEEGFVLLNTKTKKPITTIKTMLKNASRKLGIKLKGTHDLRHAAGTDSLEAAGDIRATQEVLGQVDLRSTQVYTQVSLKRKREIAEKTRAYRESERVRIREKGISTADKKEGKQ
jgi:integrase